MKDIDLIGTIAQPNTYLPVCPAKIDKGWSLERKTETSRTRFYLFNPLYFFAKITFNSKAENRICGPGTRGTSFLPTMNKMTSQFILL